MDNSTDRAKILIEELKILQGVIQQNGAKFLRVQKMDTRSCSWGFIP
ncbi:hypothetical protein ckin116_13290 [Helicobacter pylori]